MSQLSRPYQIALALIAVLAIAWFAVLRTHHAPKASPAPAHAGSSSSAARTHSAGAAHASTGGATAPQASASSGAGATPSSQSQPQASESVSASEAKSAADPSPIYHGKAPGLQGLSRAVAKAHEAVGDSQTQAKAFEGESAGSQASGGSTAAPLHTTTTPATGAPQAHQPSKASSTHASTSTPSRLAKTHAASKQGPHTSTSSEPAKTQASAKHGTHTSTPSNPAKTQAAAKRRSHGGPVHHRSAQAPRAVAVGKALKAGKVVLVLFSKPGSAEGAEVRRQVQAAARHLRNKVLAQYAKPREVGAFGTVTRDVAIYQTPTLLIIGRKGLVESIVGLTDSFSIEQAVREAR